MGFTAAALAILAAIILLALILYKFRDPHRFNARKAVRQTTGSSSPENKIE